MARATLLLLLLALPGLAQAGSVQGNAVGADTYYASAGAWHAYRYHHPGGHAALTLTWDDSLVGADLDLTLWQPHALDDGALRSDEIVARAWTYATEPQQERIALDLAPGAYVVTVEPTRAQGERYTLDAPAGPLVRAALVPGVKLGPP